MFHFRAGVSLDTRQPGSVFKILHTRQSKIIREFPRKKSSNSSLTAEKTRSVFPTKARNAEIPSGGSNDHFVNIECIDFS